MDFLYKIAKSKREDGSDSKPALATTAGNLAAIGTGLAANTAAFNHGLLGGEPEKYMPFYMGDGARVNKDEYSKLTKTLDDMTSQFGYKRTTNYDSGANVWEDVTGKGRDPIHFDPRDTKSMAQKGPHMMPNPTDPTNPFGKWTRTIHLGDAPELRKPHILAHELGHAMQSKGKLMAYGPGAVVGGIGALGLLGSGAMRDRDNADIMDKADAGFATLGTLGGLTVTGIEADASWRGSKVLADAPTRWGRIKQRAQAFRGVPTYATLAAIPGAMYFAGKKLREATANKED